MDDDSPPENAETASDAGAAPSLDDTLVVSARKQATRRKPARSLDAFLAEANPVEALVNWLGEAELERGLENKSALLGRLNHAVALIDALLSEQVNAIIHHPEFQRLEAAWRGLGYLCEQAAGGKGIKIKVLNLSWSELSRDMTRAMEFDQSQLFRKVYTEEFGMPGGEPVGLLIGDYQVQHRPSADHASDDIPVLQGIAEVAAAAFAPFIAAASPGLFGLDSFGELELPLNVQAIFNQPEYVRWRSFREADDSRFIALCLPRILMRPPHRDDGSRADGFRFQEAVNGRDGQGYLWGNPAFAFAGVAMRAYIDSGWLSDIRGVESDRLGGGIVAGLPVDYHVTDRPGLLPKSLTEVQVVEGLDRDLSEMGILALNYCRDSELAAFYASPTLQKPKIYDRQVATTNARITATLQHVLCTSRFAHYLKVMARDKVGSMLTAEEVERYLNTWLLNYTTAADDATADMKARYPLREAAVQVRERPGRPGDYMCTIHLRPHYQFDQVISSVELVTQLQGARGA